MAVRPRNEQPGPSSHSTPRWRKGDSNSRSHPDGELSQRVVLVDICDGDTDGAPATAADRGTQVRTRLAARGRQIRTLGPPATAELGASGAARRDDAALADIAVKVAEIRFPPRGVGPGSAPRRRICAATSSVGLSPSNSPSSKPPTPTGPDMDLFDRVKPRKQREYSSYR